MRRLLQANVTVVLLFLLAGAHLLGQQPSYQSKDPVSVDIKGQLVKTSPATQLTTDIERRQSLIVEFLKRELQVHELGVRNQPRINAPDALSLMKKYLALRGIEFATIFPDDCRTSTAILLHTSIWHIDPGTIVTPAAARTFSLKESDWHGFVWKKNAYGEGKSCGLESDQRSDGSPLFYGQNTYYLIGIDAFDGLLLEEDRIQIHYQSATLANEAQNLQDLQTGIAAAAGVTLPTYTAPTVSGIATPPVGSPGVLSGAPLPYSVIVAAMTIPMPRRGRSDLLRSTSQPPYSLNVTFSLQIKPGQLAATQYQALQQPPAPAGQSGQALVLQGRLGAGETAVQLGPLPDGLRFQSDMDLTQANTVKPITGSTPVDAQRYYFATQYAVVAEKAFALTYSYWQIAKDEAVAVDAAAEAAAGNGGQGSNGIAGDKGSVSMFNSEFLIAADQAGIAGLRETASKALTQANDAKNIIDNQVKQSTGTQTEAAAQADDAQRLASQAQVQFNRASGVPADTALTAAKSAALAAGQTVVTLNTATQSLVTAQGAQAMTVALARQMVDVINNVTLVGQLNHSVASATTAASTSSSGTPKTMLEGTPPSQLLPALANSNIANASNLVTAASQAVAQATAAESSASSVVLAASDATADNGRAQQLIAGNLQTINQSMNLAKVQSAQAMLSAQASLSIVGRSKTPKPTADQINQTLSKVKELAVAPEKHTASAPPAVRSAEDASKVAEAANTAALYAGKGVLAYSRALADNALTHQALIAVKSPSTKPTDRVKFTEQASHAAADAQQAYQDALQAVQQAYEYDAELAGTNKVTNACVATNGGREFIGPSCFGGAIYGIPQDTGDFPLLIVTNKGATKLAVLSVGATSSQSAAKGSPSGGAQSPQSNSQGSQTGGGASQAVSSPSQIVSCNSLGSPSTPCTFNRTFAVDDVEHWDLSLGLAIPGSAETIYSANAAPAIVAACTNPIIATSAVASPSSANYQCGLKHHTDAYAFVDFYPFASSLSGRPLVPNASYLPHVNFGIPITSQSLYRPYLGFAENVSLWAQRRGFPFAVNVFGGIVWMKQQIVIPSSGGISALRYDRALKGLWGVEVPISAITAKLTKGGGAGTGGGGAKGAGSKAGGG